MGQLKSFLMMVMMIVLTIGGDVWARGGRSSGGGSRSSSSRSSSYRSSSSSTRSTNRSSTIQRNNSSTNRNRDAVTNNNTTTRQQQAVTNNRSTNAVDRNLARQNATRNNAASQRYGNRASAESSYRSNLTSRNTYTSATAPTTRPAHIPQTVTTPGGRTNVNVTYNRLPNGSYGYGYTNSDGLFVALAANQMMVNAAMLSSAGYGHYNVDGTPRIVTVPQTTVVRHASPGETAFWIVFFIIAGVAIVAFIIYKANE